MHHARRELATRIDDVLVRRIHLHYETPDHGALAAPRVAELLGRELDWDEERVRRELAAWQSAQPADGACCTTWSSRVSTSSSDTGLSRMRSAGMVLSLRAGRV